MRQSPNPTGPASAKGRIRAFEGLGFDLDPVRTTASCMTVRPARLKSPQPARIPVCEIVPQPSGYGLLVALGREIRGR